MSKIMYKEGPPTIKLGLAGTFQINVPKDVEDEELVEAVLRKKSVKFKRHPPTSKDEPDSDEKPRGREHSLVFEEKIKAGNEDGGGRKKKKKKRMKVTSN